MGQWGEFRVKNATLCLNVVFVFHQKLGFCHFRFLFLMKYQISARIFINQSETEIADKKLSVELYDDQSLIHQLIVSRQ